MLILYKKNKLYVKTSKLDNKKIKKLKNIMKLYKIDNIVIKEKNKISYRL